MSAKDTILPLLLQRNMKNRAFLPYRFALQKYSKNPDALGGACCSRREELAGEAIPLESVRLFDKCCLRSPRFSDENLLQLILADATINSPQLRASRKYSDEYFLEPALASGNGRFPPQRDSPSGGFGNLVMK